MVAIVSATFVAKGQYAYTDVPSAMLSKPPETPLNLETQYAALENEQRRNLGRLFSPKRQLRRMLKVGFLRWLMSALLIADIYMTIWHFSEVRVMSLYKKKLFNTLITGLSIALGLNIASALKKMATDMRWWIISGKKRTLAEVGSLSMDYEVVR